MMDVDVILVLGVILVISIVFGMWWDKNMGPKC